MTAAALEALLAKYRELLRLRRAGRDDDPRPALRALAARFPGALRELDEQPLETLVRREAALVEAVAGRTAAPTWAAWTASYHGWLRVGLRMKRSRQHADLDAAADAAHVAHVAQYDDEPMTVSLDEARTLLAPPGGRLARWVLTRVARLHDVPEASIAATLFARERER